MLHNVICYRHISIMILNLYSLFLYMQSFAKVIKYNFVISAYILLMFTITKTINMHFGLVQHIF